MLPTPPPSPTPDQCLEGHDRIGLLLLDSIQLVKVLGIGAYGVVYKAVDIHTGTLYAVKALNKRGLNERQRLFQQREIQLHSEASRHPNVVSMLNIIGSSECTYVILEYCPQGDLFTNITDKGHYAGNDYMAKNAFLQILDAVEYCHSRMIFHRDLKPENVLVTNDGMNVKLADFGLATKEAYSSDFGCGSTFYMSPECQEPDPKPFSCYASGPNDIWSLGVILVNLTCGRNPWKRASPDDSTFSAYMRNRRFLKSILPITNDLDYILRRIFDLNPSNRISIPELRSLILQTPALTTQAAATNIASIPTPPCRPVDYAVLRLRIPETESLSLYSGANYAPSYGPRTPKTSQYYYPESPSYASSPAHSNFSSPYSTAHVSPSSTTPSSPATPYLATHQSTSWTVSPLPPPEQQQAQAQQEPQCHQPSVCTAATQYQSAWYTNLMPALDLAQKHMSFHPLLSGIRFV